MDVWQITVAALRRWYVLLPLLALTGWAVVTVGEGVEPEYEVQVSAMITPEREEPMIPNPYDGLDQATQVVALVLGSPETRQEISAAGLVPDYEVRTQTRSTIFGLLVRGQTHQAGVDTSMALIEHAREELEVRQSSAGLPPGAQYGLELLVQPSVTDVVYEGKLRVQAVVGFVGIALSVAAAVLFDDIVGLVHRARSRRQVRAGGTRVANEGDAHSTRLAEPDKRAQVAALHEKTQAAPVGSPIASEGDSDEDPATVPRSRDSQDAGVPLPSTSRN